MKHLSSLLISFFLVVICSRCDVALASSKSASVKLPAGALVYSVSYRSRSADCIRFTKSGRITAYGGKLAKKNRFERLHARKIKVLQTRLQSVSDPKQKWVIFKKLKNLKQQRRELDRLCLEGESGSSSSAITSSSASSSSSSAANPGQVDQPSLSPSGGNFSGSVDVVISCATSGAAIRYTLDGSLPSETDGTPLESGQAVRLDSTTTVQAVAYKEGMATSELASATYTISPSGMVVIPAGEFQMGDPFVIEGDMDERPTHAVYVDQFFMDANEVTNQQYADGLNWALDQGGLISVNSGVVYQAGSGTSYPYFSTTVDSSYSQIDWDGSTFASVAGKEDYPVLMVSWYGAVAYANWRSAMQGKPLGYDLGTWSCNWNGGYRLPTEAEWERAARGGALDHRFPWSDTNNIDHSRANYFSATAQYYDKGVPVGFDPTFSAGGVMPYTSPVGHFPANDYGLHDMAGNLWEWCNDWSDNNYYSVSPYDNPLGPVTGTYRVLRGGSWGSNAISLRCAYRNEGLPDYRAIVNGFRLAMSSQ